MSRIGIGGVLLLLLTSSAAEVVGSEPESKVVEWRGYSADEVTALRQETNLVNWDDGGEVSRFAFLHTSSLFPTAVLHRRGAVADLATASSAAIEGYSVTLADGRKLAFDDYVDEASLDGLIILHKGKIVYEKYPRMRSHDQHILWSVSKVYVSTLVALLEDRGQLDVEAPIERYLPELVESGWQGVKVIDILDMASGIDAPENVEGAYTDPSVKHYQYEASLGLLPKTPSLSQPVQNESTYEFLATLQRAHAPGERREYASVNTMVLAWLVERLTGRSFADVLSDEIWGRIGAEADGMVVVNTRGIAAVHGGILANLRDVARFGLLFTPSFRVVSAVPVVSDRYLKKIREEGRPELLSEKERADPNLRHATYQWDRVWKDGSFFKGGFGGQGLYVFPDKDLVLAFFGTHGYEPVAPSPLEVCREMLSQLY